MGIDGVNFTKLPMKTWHIPGGLAEIVLPPVNSLFENRMGKLFF